MIQLIGLRPYTAKDGKEKLADRFFENGWRAPDIFSLFREIEKYVAMVPEAERWNMFYTVATCTNERRQFFRQDCLPIDIDGIDEGTESRIVDVVCTELGLNKEEVGIVFSGNGVHIIIGLMNPITDASYLRTNKVYYKALVGRVNTALFIAGLRGKADTTVFSEARILRLPFTKNVKPKGVKDCVLVNRNIVPLNVDLFSLSQLPQVDEGEHIHPNAFARLPEPDAEAVQNMCGFIKHCRETEEPITEPEWYAMLSIVGRLANGEELAQRYSQTMGKKHPNYSREGTREKLKHALEAAGPRTCSNISSMYDGCKDCPHFGKITSPIQLTGESTIRTKTTGFYNVVIKNGVVSQGKPNYDDLEKYFRQSHKYITIQESEQTYLYDGKKWKEADRLYIHNFAEKAFKPTPSTGMCTEFEMKLKRMNPTPMNFIHVPDKINMENGVLDLETSTLMPHSPDYGFTYVIPYSFEPKGDCPTFKRFIHDVTMGDNQLAEVIVEYMGYCISGIDPVHVQKCAVLFGDGSNGKSVLLHLLRSLVGFENCSSVSIEGMKKDTHRYQLMHKMFNATDEMPNGAFLESSTFKQLVAGDTVEIRKMYHDPFMWKCTTKLIFACNDLPFGNDFSHGMYRRLIIIPFNNIFSDEKGNKDPHILDKLLAERSDILKYCLKKVDNLKNRGYKFHESRAVAAELDDYKYISDPVGRFIVNTCFFDERIMAPVSTELAYRAFVTWCMDNHLRPIQFSTFARRFGKTIGALLPEVQKDRTQEQGKKLTAYTKLKIDLTSAAF